MKVTGQPISKNVFFSAFLMPMLSGVLLGLSFPTWPSVHLEPLAWIALVPLLLSLEREERFVPFFRQVWVTMFLFCLFTLWWVSLATLSGGILTIFAQSLFSSVPLLAFYYVRRFVGFRFALLILPFLWTGWEWAYMQQDLSLGWLTLGNSQANLLWMVQYADVTGVWGVSFWVLVFNVAVTVLMRGQESWSVRSGVVLLMVFMIAVPLFYARQVFVDQPSSPACSTVRVAMVQPNIDPHEKWGGLGPEETIARLYRLTNQALQGDSPPDLLIWPETAIPFYIRDPLNKESMDSVRRMIERWNTPLLTGFPDEQPLVMPLAGEAGSEAGDDTLRNGPRAIYNASMLLMPGSSQVQVYRKMRLVPFGERVPYSEYFPWLERLSFSLSGITSWQKGREATVLHFRSAEGTPVMMANIICYESIFPGQVAQFVLGGAQFLTLVTNDGWYGTSYGPWQHAAIGRLRCIENRRAMARCANTGVTLFYDTCGRSYAQTPWWQLSVLAADVPLENELTFYTRHPDLVPLLCLTIAGVLVVAGVARKRKKERTKRR